MLFEYCTFLMKFLNKTFNTPMMEHPIIKLNIIMPQ